MDLYLIRYFLAVVEAGNFTRAAKNQNVTQPTLSAGIKKLEEQVGLSLFERTNKRVFLTDAGSNFLPHAKAVVHQINLAQQALKETGRRKLIRIGILITVAEELISQFIGNFALKHPDYEIEIVDGTERELNNRLDERMIDYALSLPRPGQEEDQILMEEGYSFAVQAGSKLAGKAMISPEELVHHNMVVRSRCEVLSETSKYFTSHNIRPRLAYRTRDDSRALAMVSAGIGGGLFPDSVIKTDPNQSRFDHFKLEGFDQHRSLALLRGEGLKSGESVFQEFEDEVRSFFRDMDENWVIF
ncbi:LysR family transcriptional regulator [Temperatibacter marinus]|uniref:LysR family transcriptional regulator n=1 Tax=Temperatibacter marinus TaxID=1456591 RepID=A0AA52EG70_9PROT|nr:LysR family transcriptional regulator [Temperatibacter marinus]WND02538.1 LysR family transcriptional regulator [Temperatibacter marinus]